MIDEKMIAGGFGLLVTVAGLFLLRHNVRNWRLQKSDPELDHFERRHLYKRFRRRVQTSATVACLGVAIALGGTVPLLQQNPLVTTIYWSVVILVTLWVILQALGDMLTTTAHSRAALARIREKQRELARQVAELKNQDSNGHKTTD